MHWPAIIQHHIFWKLGLEWPFIVASYYLKHLNPQVQSFWIHSSVFSYVIPIESLSQIWSKVRCFNTCVNVNLVNNGGNSDATSLNWSYPLLHPLAHRFPWPMLNPDEVVIFIWGVNAGVLYHNPSELIYWRRHPAVYIGAFDGGLLCAA